MDPNYVMLLQQVTTPFDLTNTLWGAVVPLLVALITNKAANPNLKAALMMVLSIVGSIGTTAIYALPGTGWGSFLSALGTALTAAVVAHFGFWKKGLGDLLANYTATFGIGANVQGSRSSAKPTPTATGDPGGRSNPHTN